MHYLPRLYHPICGNTLAWNRFYHCHLSRIDVVHRLSVERAPITSYSFRTDQQTVRHSESRALLKMFFWYYGRDGTHKAHAWASDRTIRSISMPVWKLPKGPCMTSMPKTITVMPIIPDTKWTRRNIKASMTELTSTTMLSFYFFLNFGSSEGCQGCVMAVCNIHNAAVINTTNHNDLVGLGTN